MAKTDLDRPIAWGLHRDLSSLCRSQKSLQSGPKDAQSDVLTVKLELIAFG
ncbi:hypothetical protein [Arenimonas sp.]|jgi:hypothetical protein|uniref:hypothetical protein n=1 Tax=Arenimonas sp. TaxID=1872635 RepID=UPI0037BFB0A2